jgi:hypothetical protein
MNCIGIFDQLLGSLNINMPIYNAIPYKPLCEESCQLAYILSLIVLDPQWLCPFVTTQVFSSQADALRKSNGWCATSRETEVRLEEHLQKFEDETAA